MTFKGGCLCGAVHYESSGPAVFMGNCCCMDCRRESALLRAGTVDDISAVKPQVNIYVACSLSWDRPAEGIVGFPGMAPGP